MLDTDHFSCFTDAAVEVLSSYLDAPAKVGEPGEADPLRPTQDMVVLVGFSGKIDGRLLLEFERSTALGLCRALNFGEPFAHLDQLARSTLTEFANQVVGRAIALLDDTGEAFALTGPTILGGVGLSRDRLSPKIVAITTELGTITLNLAIKDGSA